MTASQVTPGVAPVPPGSTGTGFTGGDQDWNMGTTSTTTHDWAEDAAGDWGSTEPKVWWHVYICVDDVLSTPCFSRLLLEIGEEPAAFGLVDSAWLLSFEVISMNCFVLLTPLIWHMFDAC